MRASEFAGLAMLVLLTKTAGAGLEQRQFAIAGPPKSAAPVAFEPSPHHRSLALPAKRPDAPRARTSKVRR